ncbi:hypothetical protein [Kutzneria kofuensis]|uniref:Uncharacterized protein n=1 Tax=Kutzneria kofuensis TaxID=103725 RepID=A0A7W9KL15_9PSEU|nr:hypothetical protein [Kutzneria kofuensis]MBB5894495.1 hypothetical protein [Kutzneria kofuensis]
MARLPETRQHLARLIVDEVEAALANGRELRPPLMGEVVPDALWFPALEPTLERYPADRERLSAQLQVVFEAYQADGPARDSIRYALENYVFEYLVEPGYREIVAEVHPLLSTVVDRVMPG